MGPRMREDNGGGGMGHVPVFTGGRLCVGIMGGKEVFIVE